MSNAHTDLVAKAHYHLGQLKLRAAREASATDERRQFVAQAIPHLRDAIEAQKPPDRDQYDALIAALVQQSTLMRPQDGPGANERLVEALAFLREREKLSSKDDGPALAARRREIFEQISLEDEHLQGVVLNKEDAADCHEQAQKLAEQPSENVEQVRRFSRLAEHGGAIGQLEVGVYLGLANLHADRSEDARACFLRAVKAALESPQQPTGSLASLLARAYRELGELELRAAGSGSLSAADPTQCLQSAIEYLNRAAAIRPTGGIYFDLGTAHEGLAKAGSDKPNASRRSLRNLTVYHNEHRRKAFRWYDLAHENGNLKQKGDALNKVRNLGGAVGYLMLAAKQREESAEKEAITRCLVRAEQVFADKAASKLAVMIGHTAYPPMRWNRADHDLAAMHYELGEKCYSRRLLCEAEFLLQEAGSWLRHYPQSKVDGERIESLLKKTGEEIDALDREGPDAAPGIEGQPLAKELGWEYKGTLLDNLRETVTEASGAAKEIEDLLGVPLPGRSVLEIADWLLKEALGKQPESEQSETSIGQDLVDKLFPPKDRVADETVDQVGKKVARVARKTEESGIEFKFLVVRSDELNAYALPGGFIVVTEPLAALCQKCPDEVAFVLGHEAGHVIRKHYLRRVEAGHLFRLVQRSARPNVLKLLSSGLLQSQELDADQLGVKYAHAAGYDAEAAIRFFDRIRSEEGGNAALMSRFFKSHPKPDTRIRELRVHIQNLPAPA